MAFNITCLILHKFYKAHHISQQRKSQDSWEACINGCPHFATKEQKASIKNLNRIKHEDWYYYKTRKKKYQAVPILFSFRKHAMANLYHENSLFQRALRRSCRQFPHSLRIYCQAEEFLFQVPDYFYMQYRKCNKKNHINSPIRSLFFSS